jgi:hypothetical protein
MVQKQLRYIWNSCKVIVSLKVYDCEHIYHILRCSGLHHVLETGFVSTNSVPLLVSNPYLLRLHCLVISSGLISVIVYYLYLFNDVFSVAQIM